MYQTLLDRAKSFLTPDVIKRVSDLIGETPGRTESAMTAIMPTMFAGIADTGSSASGAGRMMQLITAGGYQESLSAFPGGAAGSGLSGLMDAGSSLVSSIFGDKLGAVTDSVARTSAVRQTSATSLMSLAAPLVLGLLGREVQSKNLNASSLLATLVGERQSITKLLPASLASLFGGSSQATPERLTPPVVTSTGVLEEEPRRRGIAPWLLPLLLLAAAVALFSWLREPADRASRLASFNLPGGYTVRAPEGGLVHSLATYLGRSSDTTVPRRFVFEAMNFDTGSQQPTEQSMQTIRDLGAVLRAYPNTTIRLEGHTDNTGDYAENKRLSQQRAETIKSLLVQNNVDGSRIETAGMGPDQPLASNDTDEGRRKNRRTELVVLRKS